MEGRLRSSFERDEIAEKLQDRGEYFLADKVRRGDCLDRLDENRARNALQDSGMHEHFDYDVVRCPRKWDDEEDY